MRKFINSAEYRRGVDNLARSLEVPVPRIAQEGVIPKGLVLEAGEFFQVDLENGTAEEQLAELVDKAGLVDKDGRRLYFARSSSGYIADELARLIDQTNKTSQRKVSSKKPSRLVLAETVDAIAKSKLEAVNLISELTMSGPETLGPGSKERKSVLTNLYRGLYFGEAPDIPKSELGGLIADKLGVPWDRQCHSTGETITLEGLNRLLIAARKHLTGEETPHFSVEAEANMYAGAILQSVLDSAHDALPDQRRMWDGRSAVEEMLAKSYAHARQTEWPGWFFEFKAIPELKKKYGGGPTKVGTTTFDYQGKRKWDLKTHSEAEKKENRIPLNDKFSTQAAVKEDGLGFIILRGTPSYAGEESFYEWHNYEVRGNPRKERSLRSRKLKTGFTPTHLDFYFIQSLEELHSLENSGVLLDFKQGKQQDGSGRKVKYQMSLNAALNSSALLHSIDIKEYISSL